MLKNSQNFYDKVYTVVKKIPKGKVATYGQVAALISTPSLARAVGYALHALPIGKKIPWYRVISSSGRLSIQHHIYPAKKQAELLKKEGIKVRQIKSEFFIDLKNNLWQI